MKNIVINIGDLLEFLKDNLDEINNILFGEYGIHLNKLNLLNDRERLMLQLPIGKNLAIEDIVNNLEEKNLKDDDLEGAFLFLSRFDFFEVQDISKEYLSLASLSNDFVVRYKVDGEFSCQERDVIFAFTYLDGSTDFIHKDFEILKEDEADRVIEVFSEYYVENVLDIYFEHVVVNRLMTFYIESVDSVLNKYRDSLNLKYSPEILYTFFRHLGNIAKFSFLKGKNVGIFNVDYYEFLLFEALQGNFIQEGELESFLEIIDFILRQEDENKEIKKTLDSIVNSYNNIFTIKSEILKHNPLTSMELLMDLDDFIGHSGESIVEIGSLGFFVDTLLSNNDIKLTKKTKRITASSLRSYIKTHFPELAKEEEVDPKIKSLIELAVAIILGNSLGLIGPNGSIFPSNRYSFFLLNNPVDFIGNLITGIFRKETLSYYIGKKNIDYNLLLEKTKNGIIDRTFVNFENTKEGNKILELLQNIGALDKGFLNDYPHYRLSLFGEFLREYFEIDKDKGKIIKIDFNRNRK